MQTSDYWRKRAILLEESQHMNAAEYAKTVSEMYERSARDIEKDLAKWYTRFATNEGISLAQAKKLLTTGELKEFRMDVKEYIQKGASLDPAWRKELERASTKFHVSRLEALKVQMQQAAERVKGEVADTFDDFAVKAYSDQYYKTLFEIQKGAGVGFDVMKLDKNRINKVITKPWAADGKNFSDRIWSDRSKLVNELHQTLTRGIIQSKTPQQMVKELKSRMGVSKANTERLIYTESAFFASEATRDSYKELGIDQYEILATLDTRTSSICRELDGEKFKQSEYEVGVSAPPFHPRCRTTTVPYFPEDEEFDFEESRAARNEDGKYYTVPSKMKYPDWFKTFVDGGSKAGLKEVTKLDFISQLNVIKDELNPLVSSLDAEESKIALVENELKALEKDQRELIYEKDGLIPYRERSLFEKYKLNKDLDVDPEIKKLQPKIDELKLKDLENEKLSTRYFTRPTEGVDEWRKWKRGFDYEKFFDEQIKVKTELRSLQSKVDELEKFKSLKKTFEGYEKKLIQLDDDIAAMGDKIALKKDQIKKLKEQVNSLELQVESKIKEAGKVFIQNHDVENLKPIGDEIYELTTERKKLIMKANEAAKKANRGDITWADYQRDYYEPYEKLQETIKGKQQVLIDKIKERLGNIRSLGWDTNDIKKHLGIKKMSDTRQAVIDAYQHYPSDWVKNSIAHGKLAVKDVQRGYYSHGRGIIAISGGDQSHKLSTSIHELGHRFERTANLKKYEKIFYNRRTKGEELVWMGKGYGHSEVTRKDDFLNPYIGKDYGGDAYEIVSMGFQWAFTDPNYLLKDEDFAQFIFGLLTVR